MDKNIRKITYGGAITGLEEERAIIKSIKKSRKTHNWQQADEGALFEKELSKYLGVKHAVLTNSGSSAGLLALTSLELPRGSEVIIPAVTFPTIFNIILQCGLVPVVVDSKIGTYNLDPDDLEEAIGPNTKAIIVVHVLGNPVDMTKVMEIARKHNLYVIEDFCDALGTTFDGRKIGSFGDISFTSLHAAHIVSMGVGGAVFTEEETLARNVRMYRDWGRQAEVKEKWNGPKWPDLPPDQDARFIYEKIGYNFQILDLQAAMGRIQLKKIGKTKSARLKNFNYLYKELSQFTDLILPQWDDRADICWFAFPISVIGKRESLVKFLEEYGIETRSMFAGNITKHAAYAASGYRSMLTTGSDCNAILTQSFWISCHPRLTKADLKYIISVFKKYYEKD